MSKITSFKKSGFKTQQEYDDFVASREATKPRARRDFKKSRFVTTLSKDGVRTVQKVTDTYSGEPYLDIDADHLDDAVWGYEVIDSSPKIKPGVGLPKFVKKFKSGRHKFFPAANVKGAKKK